MPYLALSLLGPFQARLEGQPVTGFDSNRVRALLAYLAVEADRPHARQTLAELLWPDCPDQTALSNLRFALSNLRQAIGDQRSAPPFLLISRETIQFNRSSPHSLDVENCTTLLAGASHLSLEQAVGLYRGRFLEGFSVDSASFEEWVVYKREQIERQVLDALYRLTVHYEQQGEYARAAIGARRQLDLDPWNELAHQQLLRALAAGGQRSAALVQYEVCRDLLQKGLGVAPTRETTALYESIRDGTWEGTPQGAQTLFPPFLPEEGHERPNPLFVARERELAQLHRALDLALAGQGRVVFVTGEPGSGKTALVQAFARQAMAKHPNLVAAQGNSSAYIGIGDPYLPFIEILHMLGGDIESQWAGGAITREHLRRLWALTPAVAQSLLSLGPELIDRFIPGIALLARARACLPAGASWLTSLAELVKRRSALVPSQMGIQQAELFEQYTRVLQALARQQPLLLILDDLQWADAGSISLLFHLGRRLAGSRILIVGAYRLAEVAQARGSEQHPLEAVISEFQMTWGDTPIDLARADGRLFVDALLDSEPNSLGAAFRETLYQHTEGHPLFTVELLRGLRERGDLQRDARGRWVEGKPPHWDKLPGRVEAVIAEHMRRLPQDWQTLLAVAAVEGEEFTAEAVARVIGAPAPQVVRLLSEELAPKHRLVQATSCRRIGEQPLSRYRFRHHLFQKYLYASLDAVQRAQRHEAVGEALETLYGEQTDETALSLAWHFAEAGLKGRASNYFLQAGDRALRLSAYREAITHLSRGLELLHPPADGSERTVQEGVLADMLGVPLRIRLGEAYLGLADYPLARDYLLAALGAARHHGNKGQIAQALRWLGQVAINEGDFQRAQNWLEESLPLARAEPDKALLAQVLYSLSELNWSLGNLAEACTCCDEGLMLAHQLDDARLEMHALNRLGALAYRQGDLGEAQRLWEETRALALHLGNRERAAAALCNLGEIARKLNHLTDAKAYLRQSLALARETGQQLLLGVLFLNLGEVHMQQGKWVAARRALHVGLKVTYRIGAFPMVLSAMVGISLYLARQGDLARSLALLGLVCYHPCTEDWIKIELRNTLRQLGLDEADPLVIAGLEAGKGLDLAQVVPQLLTELSHRSAVEGA